MGGVARPWRQGASDWGGRRWKIERGSGEVGRKGVVGLMRKKRKRDGWAAGLERRGDRGLVLVVFSFLFLFQPFTQKSFQVF
jgi:hypothetical protein